MTLELGCIGILLIWVVIQLVRIADTLEKRMDKEGK